MSLLNQKAFKAIALLVASSVSQLYIQANLIGYPGTANKTRTAAPAQLLVGRLTTRGNQPILVNGNNAASGATILTGETIETPARVGAAISLRALGSVDLAPNTRIMLNFSRSQINVTLTQGCLTVQANKGTSIEVRTKQGRAAKTDASQAAVVDLSLPAGATTPSVNQYAAADAGAGAGGQDTSGSRCNRPASRRLAGGGIIGEGLLGGLSSNAAQAFGVIVWGGAVTAAVIAQNRGDSPQPLSLSSPFGTR